MQLSLVNSYCSYHLGIESDFRCQLVFAIYCSSQSHDSQISFDMDDLLNPSRIEDGMHTARLHQAYQIHPTSPLYECFVVCCL